MITVNLLPESLRPIKRTPLPHMAALAVLILAVLAMGKIWLDKHGEIAEQQRIYAAKEQELSGLQNRVDAYRQLSSQKERLETMVGVIKEITDNRIIWSEKLHLLTSLMPKNIWLNEISESTKRVQETRVAMGPDGKPVMDPNTGQPKLERISVSKPILAVEGYARPSEETTEEVQPYIDALETNEEFSSQFQMDNPKLGYDEDDQGFQVRSFSFEFMILPKPETAEEEPDAAGAGTEAAGGDSDV